MAALGGGGTEERGNAKRLKVTFSRGMNIFIIFVLKSRALKAFLCTEGLSPAKRFGLCPAWRPGVSREERRVDTPFWNTV